MSTTTTKVIRHGRDEMITHEAKANGTITAGDVVTEEDGGATVTRATSATQSDRLLVAVDLREAGMELGDDYEDGETVEYVAPSGGGLNVMMADGNTYDPSAEDRFVLSGTDGKVRPFDGDDDTDVLFVAGKDGITIDTDGDAVPIPVEVN